MPSRFLVIGCGGVGGIVAAHLAEAGHDVVGITTNTAIFEAVRSQGYRLRGEGGDLVVRGTIELAVPDRPCDFVLLATQPPDVERAAQTALAALAPDGLMV